MISRVERAYGIEIDDEDVFTLRSIDDVVRTVREGLAPAAT